MCYHTYLKIVIKMENYRLETNTHLLTSVDISIYYSERLKCIQESKFYQIILTNYHNIYSTTFYILRIGSKISTVWRPEK